MEKLKLAVENLRVKVRDKIQTVTEKLKEIEVKEAELTKKITSLRRNSAESELANDFESVAKIRKTIEKTKEDIIELQEQKITYKDIIANSNYNKELAEIKKLAAESKEYRSKESKKIREKIAKHNQELKELEKTIDDLTRTANYLSGNEVEGHILRSIAPLVDVRLLDSQKYDVPLTCQYWVNHDEEKFKQLFEQETYEELDKRLKAQIDNY